MISDKGPGPTALQKRISRKTESSEASKVFIKGEKVQYATGVLRERVRVAPSWQFELLLWGTYSRFPLTNHFDLLGSQSVFGIYQGPPCVHTHISKPRWILVKRPMSS